MTHYNPRAFPLWRILIGVLVGIPLACIGGLLGQFNGATAQSIGVYQMDIGQFLAAATAIERAIDEFKRVVFSRYLVGGEHEVARRNIAFSISMFLGVIVAFIFGLNMFASLGTMGWLGAVGTFLTGLVVGGGSNMVHRAFDVITQVLSIFEARATAAREQAALPTPSNKQIQRVQTVRPVEMPEAG